MAVTGGYMAMRIRNFPLPYARAYADYILHEVIPTFNDIQSRADKVSDDEFARLGSEPADDDSYVDMGSLAEEAEDKGVAFYLTMSALRQSVLNLFCVGLFHLLEQQIADLCHDGAFMVEPPEGNLRRELPDWYREHFGLDLLKLPSWSAIDELRLVANVTEHAEGDSASQLRTRRPMLFIPICFDEPHPESVQFNAPVSRPLAGDDLYVTPEMLQQYSGATVAFLSEIEKHFQDNRDEYYPR